MLCKLQSFCNYHGSLQIVAGCFVINRYILCDILHNYTACRSNFTVFAQVKAVDKWWTKGCGQLDASIPDFFIYIQKLNQITNNNRSTVEFRKLPNPVIQQCFGYYL